MTRLAIFRRIWVWPMLIGVVSALGLLSALLGDGFWDMLSWIALSIPVAVAAWAWRKA